jgi:hypothetical protein
MVSKGIVQGFLLSPFFCRTFPWRFHRFLVAAGCAAIFASFRGESSVLVLASIGGEQSPLKKG